MSSVDDDLANLVAAERRLAERSSVRAEARARRERRRALRERLLGTPVQVLLLALAGAAVLPIALAAAGGTLASWPGALALATVAATFVVPPAVAGLLARRQGARIVVAAVLATLGLELVLTFAVAFLLLGLGPA